MKANGNFFSKHTIGMLFCIGLAALTWLVGNLSKQATQLYTVGVSYKEIPSRKFIDGQTPTSLKIELEGEGFSLFKYVFSIPAISVNVSELRKVGKDKYMFTPNMLSQINKKYFPEMKLLSIHPDTLHIHYQKIQQKKIPVKLQFLFSLQEDHRVDTYQIFPDSVLVSGLEQDLDTLTGLYLKLTGKKNVTNSFSGEIPLKSTSKIHYDTDKVSYSLQIIHVTEQQMQVPIQLLHQPLKAQVQLLPDKTTVLLSGNMETIRNLKPSDIVIVADYNNRNERTIPLEIYKKPLSIEVALKEETMVEYLIIHP